MKSLLIDIFNRWNTYITWMLMAIWNLSLQYFLLGWQERFVMIQELPEYCPNMTRHPRFVRGDVHLTQRLGHGRIGYCVFPQINTAYIVACVQRLVLLESKLLALFTYDNT